MSELRIILAISLCCKSHINATTHTQAFETKTHDFLHCIRAATFGPFGPLQVCSDYHSMLATKCTNYFSNCYDFEPMCHHSTNWISLGLMRCLIVLLSEWSTVHLYCSGCISKCL